LCEDLETPSEAITKALKEVVGDSVGQLQLVISDVMQETIRKIKLERDGLVDVKLIKNIRGETFARASFLDQKTRKGRLYMSSGFEVKVLKQNEKSEHHLLVDASVLLKNANENALNYSLVLTL